MTDQIETAEDAAHLATEYDKHVLQALEHVGINFDSYSDAEVSHFLAAAQVHATLAVAVAIRLTRAAEEVTP